MTDPDNKAISDDDLAYLLRFRFLDTLLLDLTQVHEQDVEMGSVLGAYCMPQFSKSLMDAPNLGSAIYCITCSDNLRKLLSSLMCPFVVVCDLNGSAAGPAHKFITMMAEVEKVTATRSNGRFNARWFKYLSGGKMALYQKYAHFFTASIPKQLLALFLNNDTDGGNEGALVNPGYNLTTASITLQVNKQLAEDPPCKIIPDALYLGGIQSTSLAQVAAHNIQCILAVGEFPLILDPEQKGKDYFMKNSRDWDITETVMGTSWSTVSPPPSAVSMLQTPVLTPNAYAPHQLTRKRTTKKNVAHHTVFTMRRHNNDSQDFGFKEIEIFYFEIEDASHAPIESLFGYTSAVIATKSQRCNVLVHCYGGVSRSVSVILAYLMTEYSGRRRRSSDVSVDRLSKLRVYAEQFGQEAEQNSLKNVKSLLIPNGPLSLAEAFAVVFRNRPWVRPNDGFWNKLERLEVDERVKQLARYASQRYSRSGVVLVPVSEKLNDLEKQVDKAITNSFEQLTISLSPVVNADVLPQEQRRRPILNVKGINVSSSLSTTSSVTINNELVNNEISSLRTMANWDRNRRQIRSPTLQKMEEEAHKNGEASLSRTVMRGCKLDRVKKWLMLRFLHDMPGL